MKIAACVVAGGICFSGMLACWAQAPENDQFANRIVLSGNSITFMGTLAGATIESGEIQVYNANSESVWWSWTATESTPVTLTVLEVSADTFMRDYLAIWLPTSVSGFPTNISPTALLWLDSSVTLPCLKFQAVAGATYQIQLIGSSGSSFRFNWQATNAPVILTQPNNLTVLTNASALFTVAATGVQPMTYQWRFKGIDLPGETSPMLALNNVASNRVGDYSVLVTSATGSTLSEGATLAISDNRASTLNALGFVSNQFDLALSGESGTAYRIESSSNLTAWLPQRSFGYSGSLTSSIIFNKTSSAPFSVPAKSTQLYLRASRYTPANEICNNNLKQLRFAKELWARDSYKDRLDTPTVGDLKPYFKQGQFPVCPLGGYYFFYILGWPPACSIAGHILEEP